MSRQLRRENDTVSEIGKFIYIYFFIALLQRIVNSSNIEKIEDLVNAEILIRV